MKMEENQQCISAIQKKIEGKVTLEFTVNPDGSLSNYTIIEGLIDGCNEEVIRLVREGPRWNSSTHEGQPTKSVVRLQVEFILP